MEENISKLQHDRIVLLSKHLLNNIEEKTEALCIIDKDFNAKVVFKYKEDVYFVSKSFKTKIQILDEEVIFLHDREQIDFIASFILTEFESEYIADSTYISNIDSFIEEEMVDHMGIVVNRISGVVEVVTTFEYYNDLLLVNKKGFYRIILEGGKYLSKVDLSGALYDFNFDQNKDNDYIIKILQHIVTSDDVQFPHCKYWGFSEPVYLNDIIYSNSESNPLLILLNLSNCAIVTNAQISFNNKVDYDEKDIKDTIIQILNIDKTQDPKEQLFNIIDELISMYENIGIMN